MWQCCHILSILFEITFKLHFAFDSKFLNLCKLNFFKQHLKILYYLNNGMRFESPICQRHLEIKFSNSQKKRIFKLKLKIFCNIRKYSQKLGLDDVLFRLHITTSTPQKKINFFMLT